MKKLIISLAAILALSSCGIYSKYKPVTEIPDGLYGHGGTDIPGLTSADPEIQRSDTAANFGNLSWREVFTDPYLRVLIDSALVRNTDLRTAHLRVKEAEATLLSARLLLSAGFFTFSARYGKQLRWRKSYSDLFTARQCQLGDRYLWPTDQCQTSCPSCRGPKPRL